MSYKLTKIMFIVFLLFCIFNVNNKSVFAVEKNNKKAYDTTLHLNVKKINSNIKELYDCTFFNGLFTNNNNSPPKEFFEITRVKEPTKNRNEFILTIQIE